MRQNGEPHSDLPGTYCSEPNPFPLQFRVHDGQVSSVGAEQRYLNRQGKRHPGRSRLPMARQKHGH